MNILVVVAEQSEVMPMKRLLARAGIHDADIAHFTRKLEAKPSMKDLREVKVNAFDFTVKEKPYDYIVAAGETAARLVLDTSAANITKLRGRDFEYVYGVKKPGKKSKVPGNEIPSED